MVASSRDYSWLSPCEGRLWVTLLSTAGFYLLLKISGEAANGAAYTHWRLCCQAQLASDLDVLEKL